MFLSVLDIFKVGVGPSSSHTVGPMVAAAHFLELLRDGRQKVPGAGKLARLSCSLHGSLSFTGKGHATDRAVILGLAGFIPETFEANSAEVTETEIHSTHKISPPELGELDFNPDKDIHFDYGLPLDGHPNGMILSAYDTAENLYLRETYFSVGGGFILTAKEMDAQDGTPEEPVGVPFPFHNAVEMLQMARKSGKSIAQMKLQNELTRADAQSFNDLHHARPSNRRHPARRVEC
jgi:L-serine dehydratase